MYIFTDIYVRMHVCIYMWVCIHIRVCIYVCTHIHIRMYACMYINVGMYTYTYMNIRMHFYTPSSCAWACWDLQKSPVPCNRVLFPAKELSTLQNKHYFLQKSPVPCNNVLFPAKELSTRGGGLGSKPKKMYGERFGDGVEYHLMSPTPRG